MVDAEDLWPVRTCTPRSKRRSKRAAWRSLSFSRLAGEAGFVNKEIGFAWDVAEEQPEDAIFVIPGRLERCELPLRLWRKLAVDLFDPQGVTFNITWHIPSTLLGIPGWRDESTDGVSQQSGEFNGCAVFPHRCQNLNTGWQPGAGLSGWGNCGWQPCQ